MPTQAFSAPGQAVEEAKAGGHHAHGTHNYPDALTHIDRTSWMSPSLVLVLLVSC